MVGSLKFYVKSINSLSDNKNVRVSERLKIPKNRLRGFEPGRVGPINKETYLGGNYVSSLNLGTTLPTILPELQSLSFSAFIDAANLWGVDYDDAANKSNNTIRSSVGSVSYTHLTLPTTPYV